MSNTSHAEFVTETENVHRSDASNQRLHEHSKSANSTSPDEVAALEVLKQYDPNFGTLLNTFIEASKAEISAEVTETPSKRPKKVYDINLKKGEAFRNAFLAATTNLVFRRIVSVKPGPSLDTLYYKSDDDYVSLKKSPGAFELSALSESEMKQYIEQRNVWYSFVTTKGSKTDGTYMGPIRGKSDNYAEPADLLHLNFNLVKTPNQVLPRCNDLVCGEVAMSKEGPYFTKWFVCPEPLFRIVCAFTDPEFLLQDDSLQLNKLLRGSGTAYPTYTRMLKAYATDKQSDGTPFTLTEDDRLKMYWRYRTLRFYGEGVEYTHVFSAWFAHGMGLELNDENLPRNMNKIPVPNLQQWDIPSEYEKVLEEFARSSAE